MMEPRPASYSGAEPVRTKHGLAAGDAAAPPSADWTIDQGWSAYTEAEHAVWKTLFERQTRLLPELAAAKAELAAPGNPA